MKKFIYISAGIFVALLIGIITLNVLEPKVAIATQEEVLAKFDNKEDFVFVMGNSGCEACVEYKKAVLPQYLKGNQELDLVFAYTDKTFESQTAFESFVEKYNIDYEASPTTYIVKNGEVIARKEGYIKIQTLKSFVEKYSE